MELIENNYDVYTARVSARVRTAISVNSVNLRQAVCTRQEGKRENYQVCSVQYCVQQLYSELHTHMNRPNSSLDWVLSHWAHFTVFRFIFVYVLFCV